MLNRIYLFEFCCSDNHTEFEVRLAGLKCTATELCNFFWEFRQEVPI
jgi:hypothetical protein